MPLCQTVVTAVVANRELGAGLDVVVQAPRDLPAAEASWHTTATARDTQMDEVRQRWLELRHHQRHRRSSRTRTERVVALVRQ
jgi:hypothetical protein